MEKLEFVSAGWIAEIRRMLESGLAGEDLSGIDFSFCEVFTDPPDHLRRRDGDRLAWHVLIRDGRVEVGAGEIEDATCKVVGDYGTVLPLARTKVADPDFEAATQRAIDEGRVRIEGDPDRFPPVLATLERDAHDRLAVRTA